MKQTPIAIDAEVCENFFRGLFLTFDIVETHGTGNPMFERAAAGTANSILHLLQSNNGKFSITKSPDGNAVELNDSGCFTNEHSHLLARRFDFYGFEGLIFSNGFSRDELKSFFKIVQEYMVNKTPVVHLAEKLKQHGVAHIMLRGVELPERKIEVTPAVATKKRDPLAAIDLPTVKNPHPNKLFEQILNAVPLPIEEKKPIRALNTLLGANTGLLGTRVGKQLLETLTQKNTEADILNQVANMIDKTELLKRNIAELKEDDVHLLEIAKSVYRNANAEQKKTFARALDLLLNLQEQKTAPEIEAKPTPPMPIAQNDALEMPKNFVEFLKLSHSRGFTQEFRDHFEEVVTLLIKNRQTDELLALYAKLLDFHRATNAAWVFDALDIIVDALNLFGDISMNIKILDTLLERKAKLAPASAEYFALTPTLAKLARFFFIYKRYATVIKIIIDFETRLQANHTPKIEADTAKFFASLTEPESLGVVLAALGDDFWSYSQQMKTIFAKFDKAKLADALFDELGRKRVEFTLVVKEVFDNSNDFIKERIERYFAALPTFSRRDGGSFTDAEVLARTVNVLYLANQVDKDWALNFIVAAAEDHDMRLKLHVTSLLASYSIPAATNTARKIFAECDGDFRRDVVQNLVRNSLLASDVFLRQVFTEYPNLRITIIKLLRTNQGRYAKKTLIYIAENWTLALTYLPKNQVKELLTLLIEALGQYIKESDVPPILRKLKAQWRSDSTFNDSSSIFSRKNDEIADLIDSFIDRV